MRVKGLPVPKPMAIKEEESFKKKMKKSEKQHPAMKMVKEKMRQEQFEQDECEDEESKQEEEVKESMK